MAGCFDLVRPCGMTRAPPELTTTRTLTGPARNSLINLSIRKY